MTDVHELVERVESSSLFRQFQEEHPHRYLVHVFCFVRKGSGDAELGYYDCDADTINTITSNPVAIGAQEKVFKEQGVLEQLDLGRVRVDLLQARELAKTQLQKMRPGHEAVQEICILQQRGMPAWNLTLVTSAMQLLSVKIDAHSGDILSSELRSIMDIGNA